MPVGNSDPPSFGGTGLGTLTAHAVVLGEGTSNVGFATIGTSGAFMVELETGIVYGIKGYGQVDKKKISGNINDPNFNGAVLEKTCFCRGRFDLRNPEVK